MSEAPRRAKPETEVVPPPAAALDPSAAATRIPGPGPRRRARGEGRGRRRLGEYRLVRLLGEGAMGQVYEAVQESLQRRVALKVLPPDLVHSGNALARFEREAQAAARLHHPNIVQVYGSGTEGGLHFFTMEYVVGRSLRQLLDDEEAPLRDERRVAKYVLQTALALEYAHARGVVHRDVKPDNILVREDDQAMVSDFGLARQESNEAITRAGAVMGTPVYMAPEQALGDQVDHRSDVYSLGVTLYEALAGRLPLHHERLADLVRMIVEEEPPRIRAVRPDVSPDLEAIALKALRKRPDERYPSCQALADDLIRYFRGDVAGARQAPAWQVALRKLRKHAAASALGALLALATAWGAAASLRAGAGPERAAALLTAAREHVGPPLARYRAAEERLELLRGTGRGGAGGGPAAADWNRAWSDLHAAEDALLTGRDDAAPAVAALPGLHEARALAGGGGLAAEARRLTWDLVRVRWRRAERRGEPAAAAWRRELLALADGPDAAPVAAALDLDTEPAGARVRLVPVVAGPQRTWSLGPSQELGVTPLAGVPLPAGEALLEVEAEGRAPVRLPLVLDPPPGAPEPRALRLRLDLPAAAEVPAGFVYVPPGPATVGDSAAVRPLRAEGERVWVEGFFLARHEVTVAELLAFLRDLPTDARRTHLPPRLQLRVDGRGEVVPITPEALDEAAAGVRLETARAYAAWRTRQEGGRITYRLPSDAEWEKAARGPAGRRFPWGDAFDPRAAEPVANLHQALADGAPRVRPPGAHPGDRSVYGVLGLGGNLSEWVEGRFAGDPRYAVLRGGSWARGPEVTGAASREPVAAEDRADFLRVFHRVGFRLAFSLR